MRSALLVAWLICGCACAPLPGEGSDGRRTATIVELDADPEIAAALARLEVRVRDAAGALRAERVYEGGAISLPERQTVVPEGLDATRRFTVEAEAFDAEGASLGLQRVHTGFVPGEVRAVRLRFTAACRGLACGEDTTCRDGACGGACATPAAEGSLAVFAACADAGISDMDAGPRDAGARDAGPADGGAGRVQAGQVLAWDFLEGSDPARAAECAARGDLARVGEGSAEWLDGGAGVRLVGERMELGGGVLEAALGTGSLSVELWVSLAEASSLPDLDTARYAPATLVSRSATEGTSLDIQLLVGVGRYAAPEDRVALVVALATDCFADTQAKPWFYATAPIGDPRVPHHVVFVHEAHGGVAGTLTDRVYYDGAPMEGLVLGRPAGHQDRCYFADAGLAVGERPGVVGWGVAPSARLRIGGQPEPADLSVTQRGFDGAYRLLAFYARPLSGPEVARNFAAGPDADPCAP